MLLPQYSRPAPGRCRPGPTLRRTTACRLALLRCRLLTNFASCFSSPRLTTFASTILLTSSSTEPWHNRSMICRTARAAKLRDGSVAWYTYARPLASCRRYPFCSSRRSNVRTVVSLTSRLRDTTWWTASTEQGAASQTACITSFSNSVSGARTRAPTKVRNVMVHPCNWAQNPRPALDVKEGPGYGA